MNRIVLILLCCFIPFHLIAQVDDAALWLNAGIQKKINKRFNLSVTEELRLHENISEIRTAFTEISLEYKIKGVKGLTVSPGYRFIQRKNPDNSFSIRHRFLFDAAWRIKYNQLSFSLRERFQSQVNDVQSGDDGAAPVHYLRSKLAVKYDIKKVTPWISGEIFYQLNHYKGNEIDNFRLAAGADYDFNKKHGISLSYLFNREINVKNPETDYIISAGYLYKF